jgi:DNA-binding transcriptional LysR family regulator
MEAEVRALEGKAVAGGEAVSGRVRIATTEAMCVRLVEGGLLELRQEFPGIELEVLGGNRAVDLSHGEADLAVRLSPTTDKALKVRVIARFGISLFASTAYVRSRGAPRSASQLRGHHVLIPSGELAALPEAKWLASRPGVHVAFRSTSMAALVEAALRGHGICPVTAAWGSTVAGLEHLFPLEHITARPVWLVAHPDVLERPAVRVVADRIAEGFRNLVRG